MSCLCLTRSAVGSLLTACIKPLRTTLLCSVVSKRASRPRWTTGASSYVVSLSLSSLTSLPIRRALEDASIIEQSLRSELERTRITAGAQPLLLRCPLASLQAANPAIHGNAFLDALTSQPQAMPPDARLLHPPKSPPHLSVTA
jgi:hypothetical protein